MRTLCKSFFDFIEVDLYGEEKYRVKDMSYWYYSELNDEYQEHRTCEALTYDMIEEYVEKGLIFIQ